MISLQEPFVNYEQTLFVSEKIYAVSKALTHEEKINMPINKTARP